MSAAPGGFIWYELLTSDPAAAARFYAAVVGWTFTPPPAGAPIAYWQIGRDDGGSAGGMMELPAAARADGAVPAWLPYLHVADVPGAVAAITADGGRVLMPAMSLPVGDMAMVTDPAGVPFYVMRPVPPPDRPDAVSDVFDADRPQHVRWNELASPDQPGALAFYARHFDFAFDETLSMGPMGEYRFIDHGGQRLGGIMPRQPGQPARWLAYFGVPSVASAQAAIVAHGGTVLAGPHQVPGGDWVVIASDPQGAGFGVVGAKGD